MKRSTLIATILMLCASIAAAQSTEENRLKLNYGIKAGFQAITYNHTDFDIEGYTFNDNTIQSNKIGYTLTPFLRLTKGKFYIQTEAALGITRYNFDFNDNNNTATPVFTPATAEYDLTTYNIQIPLLVGYNFISYEDYGMSVFTGPRVKFIFTSLSDQDFQHFKHEQLMEELNKRDIHWELGLGIRIFNVIMDITYDWGLSMNKTKITDKESGAIFTSKRNDSTLGFSVGFIF